MSATESIALIGCGGISAAHLAAYRDGGLNVILLCDRTLAKAERRRDEFFPDAEVTDDLDAVWGDERVRIVDIATHTFGRSALIRSALDAGKHVLSQKPFVLDLDEGRALDEFARSRGMTLAVNHNGRWAPHFAAALRLIEEGAIGMVTSADFAVYWPHDQLYQNDPHFSTMADLVLYDFGIHWFDLLAQIMVDAGAARRVFALTTRHPGSRIGVDTDATALVEFERGSATVLFRASAAWAESGSFRIEGTAGAIVHAGTSLGGDCVVLHTDANETVIELDGDWFSRGMIGTMRELGAAIDENRDPRNSAASALSGLRLCFAALESARTGLPVDPSALTRYER